MGHRESGSSCKGGRKISGIGGGGVVTRSERWLQRSPARSSGSGGKAGNGSIVQSVPCALGVTAPSAPGSCAMRSSSPYSRVCASAACGDGGKRAQVGRLRAPPVCGPRHVTVTAIRLLGSSRRHIHLNRRVLPSPLIAIVRLELSASFGRPMCVLGGEKCTHCYAHCSRVIIIVSVPRSFSGDLLCFHILLQKQFIPIKWNVIVFT